MSEAAPRVRSRHMRAAAAAATTGVRGIRQTRAPHVSIACVLTDCFTRERTNAARGNFFVFSSNLFYTIETYFVVNTHGTRLFRKRIIFALQFKRLVSVGLKTSIVMWWLNRRKETYVCMFLLIAVTNIK